MSRATAALLMVLVFILASLFYTQPLFADSTAQGSQDQGTVAGIPSVSPEKFAGKLTKFADALYNAASPITDALAKTFIAFAGIVVMFFLLSGYRVVIRAIGTVVTIALGLLLWYGAPYVVALLKWLAVWLQS
ncbi:MAG: hypothetical protein ACPLRH_00160 [Desulfotomaculales bacterium]